jgi:hypothetical protein
MFALDVLETLIHTDTHTHKHIHIIYIYTYVHTYMHAYIHTYRHTCIHTDRHENIREAAGVMTHGTIGLTSKVRTPMFEMAWQRHQRGQLVVMQSALENKCNEMSAADAWRGEGLTGRFGVDLSERVKKGVSDTSKHSSRRSLVSLPKNSICCWKCTASA